MRPKKYKNHQAISISVDEKDIEFLDSHRGKLTRGDYLIESMYAIKQESSDHIKELTERYKQLSIENQELKKELMFLRSKHKPVTSDNELIKWYDARDMTEVITKFGDSVNWKNLFDKNIDVFATHFRNFKELENFCLERYKNNDKKTT